MSVIALKNWERHQHYKDRDPPWVKLYRDLLTSESWVLGTDVSRVVQVASILLAARYSNAIPNVWNVFRKVTSIDCTEAQFSDALSHLVATNFLEIQQCASVANPVAQVASNGLAKCSTEAEAEKSRAEGDKTRARDPVPRESGDALCRTPSAEDVLAEMSDSWKADVEGVNVEALQRFFDFVAREINPPSKRKEFSPSARIATAKKLAGMGDADLQAQVVEQSISNDHATLYALKDRPSKQAASAAQSIADQRRELSGLKLRAEAIGFRAPHRGEDVTDYRVMVERAERDAKDRSYREGVAKRGGGPQPLAKLLPPGNA
jgi:hypothetical protein